MTRLRRYGAFLLRPRRTLAGGPPGDPRRDGWVLGGFYLAAVWLGPLIEQLAHLSVTRDLGGLALMAGQAARALLVPVLLTVVAEGQWGERGEALRGLALVPFVAVTVTAHALETFAGAAWPRPYLPELAGAAVGLAYVFGARGAARSGGAPADGTTRGRGAVVLAAALALAGGATAVADARRAIAAWDRMRPLGPGDRLPALTVPLEGGGRLATAELADGRPTVLVFWATWCGVCRTELPMYERLGRTLAGEGGRMVLVLEEGRMPATEAMLVARSARRRFDLSLPLAVDDGRLYAAAGGRVLPHVVVLAGDGTLAAVHEGRVLESTLRADLEKAGLTLSGG